MKLQKQISRKYKETEYKKYWVVIPSRIIKKLKWEKKDELDVEIKYEGILIKCK